MLIQKSVRNYLKELSSDSPTPGGGSASALVGALGASLILMVARIVGKRASTEQKKELDRAVRFLEKAHKDIQQVIDLDVRVYEALIKSYKAAKSIKNKNFAQKKIEAALGNSFRLQADLALLVLMTKEAMIPVRRVSKGSIANDLIVAEGFLDAAFRGAIATAKINLVYMKSPRKKHYKNGIENLEKRYKSVKV